MNFPDQLTVLRSTGTDSYGDPISDWSSPTEIPARGFAIDGSARRKDKTVLMPPDSDIKTGDRVRLDGVVYQVVDEPKKVRSPRRLILWSVSIRKLGGNTDA